LKLEDIRVLIIRAAGTNCDAETRDAVLDIGAKADVVHLNRIIRGNTSLEDYHGIILPGGFSFGDRVRSGAILGKLLRYNLKKEFEAFIDEKKPVLGICNGFQALIEAELLPGNSIILALGKNLSARFEDRWCYLKSYRGSLFSRSVPELVKIPVANGEGRLILPEGREERIYQELEENRQIAFKYATKTGEPAEGSYPENPSGSYGDIAGLTNEDGNVLGMMPHPERAFYRYMYPDWTREEGKAEESGDGYYIFKDMLDYIVNRL